MFLDLSISTIYVFFLPMCILFSQRLSAFTRGGAYKVTPDAVELSKTLALWPGYQYNPLYCQWVIHIYFFPVFLSYTTFADLMLIFCR